MKCERAQERILDLDPIDAEVSEHLSGCNTCACFLGLQRSIDEQLARAYTAPPLTSVFRQDIRTRIEAEKWRYRSSVLSAFIAPAASLATSGVCALLLPQMAAFLFGVALILGVVGYAGQIVFVWLTEELGEG